MATPPAPPSNATRAPAGGDRPKLAHIRALDGVRGVAMLAVIASHTGYGQLGHGFYRVGAVSLVVMFAAADVSYRWLERPVIDRMRRYETRVRRAGSKPAVAPGSVPVAVGAG
jgi:peptidoglycan/LPS O-acetylase OafA/YrhL